jgi:glycosyltransferase involved in cell wall biosynthesis
LPNVQRVLLVEHLDAVGAAPADARLHAAALRAAHFTVEGLVLDGDRRDDLLFPMHERRVGTGYDVLDAGPGGLEALARRVRTSRADMVLWASTAPGGGEAARALPDGLRAAWWPTGHAPSHVASGPLPALDASWAPLEGSAVADDGQRRRLSLWDGPYVLVPAPVAAASAPALVAAFAEAASGRDEVDLVVLDHPEPALEALARRAGIAQRVHFVGPAPRDAELAWLHSAAIVIVCGDAPVSGGLVLRALAGGSLVRTSGAGAAPIADWLAARELAWGSPARGGSLADAIDAALERDAATHAARERAREVAAGSGIGELAARLARALRAEPAERHAA